MKVILFVLFFIFTVMAEELVLDDLLSQYTESESLYHKTKQESSGFLLVYSREDLERMQAYTLSDVLKTVRLYTLQANKVGALSLLQSGSGMSSIPAIKLYIDDYELGVVIGSTPLKIYANMDLYFVDHIEIYQGGSSIAFGNEIGSMVIRLYTKDPERENATSAQLSIDSYGGGSLRGVDTGNIGDYSYLAYANAAANRYDTYERNNHELSRDGSRYQAFFKLFEKNNFDLQANIFSKSSDIFNGFGSAPTGESNTMFQGYLSGTKYFENNLKIALSYSSEEFVLDNQDDIGMKLSDGTLSNDLYVSTEAKIYKATVEKKVVNGASDLLLGVQWQHKSFTLKEYESDGVDYPVALGPDRLDIFMVYAEELYNINENHLVALSAKLDHYRDGFSKSSNEYAVRAGYTAIFDKVWTTKFFAIRRYQYPNMLQTSVAPNYNPNPELESATINMFSAELTYQDDSNTLTFNYAYKQIDDAIVFNPTAKKYVNKDDRVHFRRGFIRGEHRFDYDNKIIAEFYKVHKDLYVSPGSGALIQMFNKVGKVDIYNELIYRDDYTINGIDMNAGYDYSLGLIYPVNRQLTLKCKGENLFDRASAVPIGSLEIPAIERRITATVEYIF